MLTSADRQCGRFSWGRRFGESLASVILAVALTAGLEGMLLTAGVSATTFSWNDSLGGAFGDASNWTPAGGPPDSALDTALFDLFAVYEVEFFDDYLNGRFEVVSPGVTFNLFAEPLFGDPDSVTYTLTSTLSTAADISSLPGSFFPAALTVTGGNIIASGNLFIGQDVNSTGSLELVEAHHWTSSGTTYVGFGGDGTLLIDAYSDFGAPIRAELINDDGVIGTFGGSSGNVTVKGTWTNNGDLSVGIFGDGILTIETDLSGPLAMVTSNGGAIASQAGSTSSVTVNKGMWVNTGSLYVGGNSTVAGGDGTLTLINSSFSTVTVTDTLMVWPTGTFNMNLGTLNAGSLTGGGNMTWTSGSINITGGDFTIDSTTPLGASESLDAGKPLTVSGALRLAQAGQASVTVTAGGTVISDSGVVGNESASVGSAILQLTGAGTTWSITNDLNVGGRDTAHLTISDEAVVSNVNAFVAVDPLSSADITLTVTGAQWTNTGSVYLGGDASTVGGSGTTQIQTGTTMDVTGTLKVWDNYVLSINGGTVNTPTLDVSGTVNVTGTFDLTGSGSVGALVLNGGTVNADVVDFGANSLTGSGAINSEVSIGGDVTATGDLTLGNASSFVGVQIGGGLDVGANTVTINKKGFFAIGTSTVITGGTLTVSDGAAIPVGTGLVAEGTINGRIVQQAGSSIETTGDLTLGDATSPAGFFSDGDMTVQNNIVTLLDANEAVLGSLTTLGRSEKIGTVAAANGAVLEFGKNIIGHGLVETPDDPTKPLINNGSIVGNSLIEPITLSGYVKGVGTCDNCNITGTDAPGFSAAAVNRGSVSYNGTLEIEIGGLNSGGDFDQLNHILGAGVADLGGTLDVLLINGFTPSFGDMFEIITATSIVDTFDIENLPDLGGLVWNVIYGATNVVLEVVSPFTADFDLDGDVDADDLTKWQGDFGGPGSDADGDGDSDGADYLAWQRQFGSGVPGSLTSSQVVPEPTSTLLVLAGVLFIACMRRISGELLIE